MSEITTADLKEEATKLGIKFTSKTSDDTLLAKIEAEKEKLSKEANDPSKAIKKANDSCAILKRVTVTPLNPLEIKQTSKYISFCNSYITINKAVLFNKPIFLEVAVIDLLKSMRYQQVPNSAKVNDKANLGNVLVPAYSVTDLPDLTKEEFEVLRKDKAIRNSTIKD